MERKDVIQHRQHHHNYFQHINVSNLRAEELWLVFVICLCVGFSFVLHIVCLLFLFLFCFDPLSIIPILL